MAVANLFECRIVEVDIIETADFMAIGMALKEEPGASGALGVFITQPGELVEKLRVIAAGLAKLDATVCAVGRGVIRNIDGVGVAHRALTGVRERYLVVGHTATDEIHGVVTGVVRVAAGFGGSHRSC